MTPNPTYAAAAYTVQLMPEHRLATVTVRLPGTGIAARARDVTMPPDRAYLQTPVPYATSMTPHEVVLTYGLHADGTWHAATADVHGHPRDPEAMLLPGGVQRLFCFPGVPGARVIPLLQDPAPEAVIPPWLADLAAQHTPAPTSTQHP